MLEEAAIVKWHGKTQEPRDDGGAKVREAAAPFMEWLREAEEESSAESAGADEGDEIENTGKTARAYS